MLESISEPARTLPSSPWLRRWFCALVLALAVYQFSENTADPDLWAHAMFGEQILLTGKLQHVEPYSWTAKGSRWINHEWLSEVAIGAAHLAGGGAGILLLKMLVGLATFGIALRLGGEDMDWPWRAMAWAVGAVAVIEISYGFAARPQIFTALFLAVELWLLRKIVRTGILWAIGLPLLFVLWINTHGGVLAGGAMLFIAAVCMTVQALWNRNRQGGIANPALALAPRTVIAVWLAGVACAASLLVNPYGYELVRWIVSEVMDLSQRPELQEWGPTRLGLDHASFFILLGATVLAFTFSRRRRALWEMAICASLAVFALRSVRHTPLFAIGALAFVPPHLADGLERLRPRFAGGMAAFRSAAMQTFLRGACALLALCILGAAFTLHKDHPFTMEVPRQQYPVAAVQFMRQHQLGGRLLVFFDWGEMCLWELPDCTVSIDGRWDTCYPRALIVEHWKFYNDQPVDRKILAVNKADIALLPANLAGATALWKTSGWKPIYYDDLAVILVHNIGKYPQLDSLTLPQTGSPAATLGRAAFPSAVPGRAKSQPPS